MNSLDYFAGVDAFIFNDFGGCTWAGENFLTYASNQGYLELACNNPGVVAVILPEELASRCRELGKIPVISSAPRVDFFEAFSRAVISGAYGVNCARSLSDDLLSGAGTFIDENVSVGQRVRIGKNCLILNGSIIEDDVVIHDNVIIGSEGMQTYISPSGGLQNVPHAGGVRIRKGVTLLQGVNISKALYREFTEIGQQSVISIGASIGHGCVLGQRVQVSGGALIGGSTIIGDGAWIGPRALIADGLVIGAAAKVRLGSVVVQNVPDQGDVSGNFALPHSMRLREFSLAKRKLREMK